MPFQVSAKTKRGGSVGVLVDTARQALAKADEYVEDGLTDIVFRGEDNKVIDFEEMRSLARR